MIQRRNHLDLVAIAVMLLCCACWGLNQVAIKVGVGGIPPVLQAGLRSAGAALLVWGWSCYRGVRLFERDGTLLLGIVVAVLFAGEFIFLYGGLVYTNASRAVLFLYMSPFAVAVGAHLFLPGERLRPLQIAGLVCAFAGLVLAFADAVRLPTDRQLLGDVLVFIAALLWGATTVVVKASRLARISPHKTLLYQLAGSVPLLGLASWALGEPGLGTPSALVLGALAYQIVAVAFASYLAWFWLIAHYPAFRLASFSFLTPLFGLAAGWLLLAEPITKALAIAMALVGAGIYLVNRRGAPMGSPRAVAGAGSQVRRDAL